MRIIRRFMTARSPHFRLSEMEPIAFRADEQEQENRLINVYPDVEFQEIIGFGGACTEAAAVALGKLDPEARKRVLRAYFDPEEGIGYTLCRTHIQSCDFSLGSYSYVEDGDERLDTFDLARDRQALLPLIRDAARIAGASFRLLASPWSPPPWMKTNGRMTGGGRLRPEYRAAWAQFFTRYIRAMAEEGVDVWGVSVQNEAKATQIWESCVYSAEEERDFVRDYLGPTLEREGLSHVRLFVWDHNKERLFERARIVLDDPEAAKYVAGVAFHWYSGDHFESLDLVRARYPGVMLLATEGCQEGGVRLGDWSVGERYAHHIIGDLTHGAAGWIDWNIALDENGGPNHVGNYCDAPVIVDTRTGQAAFQSSYYYIGHFSRFVRPGARRIGCTRYTDRLEACAFRNADGTVAVVVLNRTDEPIPFTLRYVSPSGLSSGAEIADADSPPHSIQTLVVSDSARGVRDPDGLLPP